MGERGALGEVEAGRGAVAQTARRHGGVRSPSMRRLWGLTASPQESAVCVQGREEPPVVGEPGVSHSLCEESH